MPAASPTGWRAQAPGRPRSYSAWPVSCSTPSSALRDLVLGIEGGDADIGGRAAAEGMQALVQPGMGVVEPDPLRQRAAQRPLRGGGERAGQRQRGAAWRPGSPRPAAAPPPGSPRRRRRPARHPAARDAGLVAIHQRIIGREAEHAGAAPAPLPAAAARPRYRSRADQGEIGLGLGAAPDRLAGGIGAFGGLHQRGRQRRGARDALRASGGGWRRPIRPVAAAAARSSATSGAVSSSCAQPGQHRELFAARRAAAGRHHRAGIPVQHRARLAQGGDAGEAGLQAVIGIAHAAGSRALGGGPEPRIRKAATTPTSAAASPYQVMA